jgi:protein gp37
MSNPIGWCTKTWNPVTGCSKVSPACDHCYAERMSKRLAGRFGYPADNPFGVTFHPDKLDEPLTWRNPQRVFVCSMGDLFHEDVDMEWFLRIFDAMWEAPQHTYLLLTKRPECMREWVDWTVRHAWQCDGNSSLGPHIFLGVTAENQEQADKRIPILLDTPAAKRFVSCEPLLGPVNLQGDSHGSDWLQGWEVVTETEYDRQGQAYPVPAQSQTERLDWCICGPENGPGKRPMDLDWARSLRDQCVSAGVPFWYKGGLLDGVEHQELPS